MSKSDETRDLAPEMKIDTPSVTCVGGCHHGNAGLMRAALYTPVALLVGAMFAIAAFPGLAEYAAPLLGESEGKLVYPFNGTGMTSGGGHCCASMQASTGSCSVAVLPARSCRYGVGSCCSSASETTIDAEAPINAELADGGNEVSADDVTADAISAVNLTEPLTSSN